MTNNKAGIFFPRNVDLEAFWNLSFFVSFQSGRNQSWESHFQRGHKHGEKKTASTYQVAKCNYISAYIFIGKEDCGREDQ